MENSTKIKVKKFVKKIEKFVPAVFDLFLKKITDFFVINYARLKEILGVLKDPSF